MTYPSYLTCTSKEEIINFDSLNLEQYFLIRTSLKLPVFKENGRLDKDSLKPVYAGMRKHFDDLSTNINPEFLLDHINFRILSNRARTDWVPGIDVSFQMQLGSDFEVREGIYPIILPASKWHNRKFEIDGAVYEIKIIHTPVLGNYWHASLRCFDVQGKHIVDQISQKRRKTIYDGVIRILEFNSLPSIPI